VTAWQSYGRFIFTENAGVASDTVQMMQARLQTDVISKHPAACVILAGSNSTTKGQAHWDDARSVYENGIIKPLMAAGILPVLCTIPPRDGSRTVGTGGTYGANGPLIYRLTLAWNVFVRAMAAKYRLPLADIYAVVTDPATGEYRTPSWTSDGVHWNTFRSHEIAKAMVDVLTPLFPNVVVPLTKDRELPGGNAVLNWAPDGLFLGAFDQGTGGRYPLGMNGTSSTSLTVAPADPVAGDPLTAGRWLQLSKTAGSSSFNVNLVRTLAQILSRTGVAVLPGQRVAVGFTYKLENLAGDGYVTVSFAWRDSGGATLRQTTPMNQYRTASKGVVYIEDVVPEGAIDCRLDFSWSATGTGDFYVGQVTEINLDGNGIPSLKTAA
jgi:lysophospholipase L1-like esterase